MASIGVELDKIITKQFDNFLIIPFSKEWLSLNNGKPIEFSVHVKENNLILSGKLASLDRIKDVDTNVM